MKQSQVKPGVYAMLSLGRRGSVRVLVRYQHTPRRAGDVRWAVVDSSGTYHEATPRRLQPVPDGPTSLQQEMAQEHHAFMRDHFDARAEHWLAEIDARKGQTIDAGDVVITTTLHRLG